MKKRGRPAATKKPATTNITSNRCTESPKPYDLNLDSPEKITAGGTRRISVLSPVNSPNLRRMSSLSSIAELKEVASSSFNSIKRQVERSHSDILKEFESSHSRLNKRFKIQSQACQQLKDETEMEFKKMSERITESCQAMKVSYAEFIVEAQTTASRGKSQTLKTPVTPLSVCKTSIPEKAQSFDKAIDALRSRYGILSTPA